MTPVAALFQKTKEILNRLELNTDQKLAVQKFPGNDAGRSNDDVFDEVDGLVVTSHQKREPAAVDGVDRQRLARHHRRRLDAMLDGVTVQPDAT